MKYLFLIVVCLSLWQLEGVARQARVGGVIINKVTREPVPFASIGIVGTSRGTAANDHGEFELKRPCRDTCSIKISAIGFYSKTLTTYVAFDTIELRPAVMLLKEVTVLSEQVDPAEVVAKAIKEISNNYMTGQVLLKAFYRFTKKRNDEYRQLSEVAFDHYREKGYNSFRTLINKKDRYAIRQVRRSLDLDNDDIITDNHISKTLNADIVAYQNSRPTSYFFIEISAIY